MENIDQGNPFGMAVYSYSRAQAIADGVLVDYSTLALQSGFKWPTVMTEAVHNSICEPPDNARAGGESVTGRAWDILHMLRMAIAAHRRRGNGAALDRIEFEVIATDHHGRKPVHQLYALCHPGDTPAPVITIMLQGED